MNIPLDLFREMIATFEPQGASLPGENRSAARVKVDGRILILPTPHSEAAPIEVALSDLSLVGLRFLHTEKLKLGEQIVAMLPRRDGQSVAMLCTIAYYEPLDEQLFAVGAKFIGTVNLHATARLAS